MRVRLLIAASLVTLAGLASAQEAPKPSPSPSPSPSPATPKITLTGQLRIRPELRTPLAPRGEADLGVLQRSRLGVTAQLAKATALVEVQDARHWGSETSTTANDRNVDLHQAYVRVPDLAGGRLALTAGRQELAYGDERLVGALDWSTTARSFDAALLRWSFKGGSLDTFGALVNDRRTSGRGDGDQTFAGAYGRFLRGRKDVELDAYALLLDDARAQAGATGGTDTRVATLGVRARRVPARGFQASAEIALQGGHRASDDHRAHAFAGWVGYAFGARFSPVVRLEVAHATGDDDPADGTWREFHNLFPTNHPYYGYADLLGWRNMRAVRLGVTLTPRAKHALSLDVHDLALAEAGGAWKDAGGEVLAHDPAGRSGRALGRELDLLWRFPLRDDVGAMLGYSAFFPGDFAKARRTGRVQSFAYGHLLVRF